MIQSEFRELGSGSKCRTIPAVFTAGNSAAKPIREFGCATKVIRTANGNFERTTLTE